MQTLITGEFNQHLGFDINKSTERSHFITNINTFSVSETTNQCVKELLIPG